MFWFSPDCVKRPFLVTETRHWLSTFVIFAVPPPIPPRGNRDKESNQNQISNICHVSTTYIGGASTEIPSEEQSTNIRELKSGLKQRQPDEVTIGNQSTLSSQVSVSNKQQKHSNMNQTGLQLKISVNSSSVRASNSFANTSNVIKKHTITKVSSESTTCSSNKTVSPKASKSTREGPKIKKLRDLLLADSDVESS